jgi:hypothetical protein
MGPADSPMFTPDIDRAVKGRCGTSLRSASSLAFGRPLTALFGRDQAGARSDVGFGRRHV